MFERIMKWWCRNFHDEIFRPVHGEYRCAVCLRTYPVDWQVTPASHEAAGVVLRSPLKARAIGAEQTSY